MYFGNSLFPFRQKLGNNPRLKVLSSCILLSLLCISHLLSTHFQNFHTISATSQTFQVRLSGHCISDCISNIVLNFKFNAWGLIYFFIFEGIRFLIIKDTMINTEVHYMYTLCLFMSTWERSVAPTCELWDVAQLKAMVSAMYCQIFLHLIQQLAEHVKGNQRNMERHLFSIKKKKEKTQVGMYIFSSSCS